MANGGGQKFKMNFTDDSTAMNPKTKGSKYFGVTYNEKNKTWAAQRWSKAEKTVINKEITKMRKQLPMRVTLWQEIWWQMTMRAPN